MTDMNAREIQWFAVRMKPNASGGARTTMINVEIEKYQNRAGQSVRRRVKGTGKRVFVPELLLKRAGFEVFLPLKQTLRVKNRFTKEKHLVASPLLADWMFVGWPADESRWLELMGFDVVAGVMGTGGRPVMIPEKQIMKMMRVWGGGFVEAAVRRRIQARQVCAVGDTARVVDGPFEGKAVCVVEMSGGSAKAMMKILGGDIEIEISADLLSRVEILEEKLR